MILSRRTLYPAVAACLSAALSLVAGAQQEKHGRGYKPPPPTAEVVVTVEKAMNDKPLPNASVIFRSLRNDEVNGNLEMKTDTDGQARIDLLEVGSHIVVQVLADGFATYAGEFDLTSGGKQMTVKLEKPRAQVTMYGDTRNQPASAQPGVQEHIPAAGAAPTSVPPAPASPTGPLQTTPPANTPSTATPNAGSSSTAGTPK